MTTRPKKTSLVGALHADPVKRRLFLPVPPTRFRARARAPVGATTNRADRSGKVNVTGYFDPAVRQSIRRIQAEYPELTQQDILAEALNLVFAKYGVPEAAKVSGRG
jgi:antitoxin-like ribbon-helix-helix protein